MYEYGWCVWAMFTDSLALLQSSLFMLPVLKRRTVIWIITDPFNLSDTITQLLQGKAMCVLYVC